MRNRKINLVGIGPGDAKLLTVKAKEAIVKSDIVIGAKRQLKILEKIPYKNKIIKYKKITEIKDIVNSINPHKKMTILASGDANLYGIKSYLQKELKDFEITTYIGISALNYLFDKVSIKMDGVFLTSLHGKEMDKDNLLYMDKIGLFTDAVNTPYKISRYFLENGQNPLFIIGENLSYEDEKITRLRADEIKEDENKYLITVIILKEGSDD